MLRESLATPVRGSAAAATALVGSALLVASVVAVGLWVGATTVAPRAGALVPLALVPYLLLRGYGVRVVACGLRGDPSAPTFSRPGVLLRDGVKSTLLNLLLLLPLWVVVVVGSGAVGVVELGRVPAAGVGNELSAAVAGFTGIVAISWLAWYAYLRPAALACLAVDGRLRDALHPGKVLRVAFDGDYLKGWTLGTLVLATGVVVTLPFVPFLVGIPLLFGVIVAANSLSGRGAAGVLRASTSRAPDAPADGVESVEPSPGAEPAPVQEAEAEPDRDAEPEPDSTTATTSPPGSDAFLDVPEPDPAVQTGRRVPLTATDILSKSVGAPTGDGGATGSETTPDADGDATDRAAGVDDSGELVDEARDSKPEPRREGPVETDFAWGATEPAETGESGGDGGDDGEEDTDAGTDTR